MKILGQITKDKPWVDYSSLKMLCHCPRSYWWRIHQHITYGDTAALVNGKAYHKAISTYHNLVKDGCKTDLAIEAGLKAMEVIMRDITIEDPRRNVTVARDTLIQYFRRWIDEPYRTIEAEVPFAIDLGDFMFVGSIDRIADSPFGVVVMETKTTTIVGERWGSRAKPNLQIDGYVAAVAILSGLNPYGGVLDVIPIHEDQSKRKSAFRIGPSPRSDEDIDNWLRNVREWWRVLCDFRANNFFPQNTEVCVPILGMSCGYTILCEKYPNPFGHEVYEIPEEYRREEWVPYEELSGLSRENTNNNINSVGHTVGN